MIQQIQQIEIIVYFWCSLIAILALLITVFILIKKIPQLKYSNERLKKDNEDYKDSLESSNDRYTFYKKQYENKNELPSYILKNSHNRIDTKLFNQLKDIGCNNNLIPEILEYLRLVYLIHIYIYGYGTSRLIAGIEAPNNRTYLISRLEYDTSTMHGCYTNAINEALHLIRDDKLQPNIERRSELNH